MEWSAARLDFWRRMRGDGTTETGGQGQTSLLVFYFSFCKMYFLSKIIIEIVGSTKTTLAGEYLEEVSAAHNLEQHVHCATRGKNPLDLILSDSRQSGSGRNAQPHRVLRPCKPSWRLLKHSHTGRGRHSRTVWRYSKADWSRLNNFFQGN